MSRFGLGKKALGVSVGRLLGCLGCIVLGTQCSAPPKKHYGRKMPRHIESKIGNLAPRGIEDSLATPPHSFSREDYPFDARGRYREDWVVGGESTGGFGFLFGRSASTGVPRIRYHVVKKGDTLYGLSREYGITLHALRSANKLSSYTIRIGQTLKIPSN